ncbi:hypothetical protein N2152v2_009288 [Parachlorella kessleri]
MEGRHDLAARVWMALRVLGHLISAASTEEKLRPIVGFPAVWCGVDLIKNMGVMRPDSIPPGTAMKEFASPLAAALLNKPPPHSPVSGCPCCEAYHTWHSCLLSASADMAVLGTTAVEYRTVPQVVEVAFEAVVRALGACSGQCSQSELALLFSTGRLFSLTPTIADRADLPIFEVKRMLRAFDNEAVMFAHILAVRRLRMLVFSEKGSEKEGSEEGEEPATSIVSLGSKGELLDWLRGVLSGLLVFLEAGMQLDAFMRNEGRCSQLRLSAAAHFIRCGVYGFDTLLGFFELYTDRGRPLGELKPKYEEVLLVAAQCLVALLNSFGREEAQEEFTAAAGFQRLLDTVDALPLGRLLNAVLSGRHTLWQLQCVLMKVLELATLECPCATADLTAEGGIISLVKAARLNPDKPVVCPVSDHYKDLPLTQEQEVGVRDLLASVPAHAFAVIGQACISAGKAVDEHQDHPYCVLARISSLEEMEQLAKLGEVRWDEPEGRPWAPLLAKNAPFCSLRVSAILCAQGLLGQGVKKREDFMQLKYKELFSAHMGIMQPSGGGNTQLLAKSVVFRAFARILRERASWRRQLLQERVHLLAGATLTEAVTTLKHETLAGRKARLHKLQARSRGRAGASACGCGLPGCTLGDMGGSGGGLAKAARVIEATSLLAGKEGRQAALEVLTEGRLAEAANASPALAIVSVNLEGPETSLKEWLAWGEQLVQQSGGKRTAQLDAEKAAEAAAAALLAEEEGMQRKAAAKAAKRQRQKAAKQHAGSAQQPEKSSDIQQHVGDLQDVGDAHTPIAAVDSSSSAASLRGEHVASLVQGPATQRPIGADTAASFSASRDAELTSAAQPSEEDAEDTAQRQVASRGGSQQQTPHPGQYREQASGNQEVPARRAMKLKKAQKAMEQQQPETPSQNGSLPQTATDLLRAAPAGKERASPAMIPALFAILGPPAPAQPGTNGAAAVTAPATPPRPAPPALPPPSSAEVPLLSPEPLTMSEAAPPVAAAMSGGSVESEAPDPAPAAKAAQVAEYQALLDYLLPGISLSDRKPQAKPISHETAAPASDGSLSASSQGRNSVPPEACSNEQQRQGQEQAFHTGEGLSNSGGSSKLPPALEAALVCRLTGQLLSDPVIAADGFTYEREALTAWLQLGKLVSPATGRPLSSGAVRPNLAVRDLLSAVWVC